MRLVSLFCLCVAAAWFVPFEIEGTTFEVPPLREQPGQGQEPFAGRPKDAEGETLMATSPRNRLQNQGRVHGQLIDGAGQPLAGVALRASSMANAPGLRVWPAGVTSRRSPTGAPHLEQAALELLAQRGQSWIATTDEAGRFEFHGLPPQHCALSLVEHHGALSVRNTTGTANPDALLLQRAVPIPLSIQVTSENEHLTQGNVQVDHLDDSGFVMGQEQLAWRASEPLTAWLPPGRYALWARAERRGGWAYSTPAWLQLSPVDPPATARLLFEDRFALGCRVLMDDQPGRSIPWSILLYRDPPQSGWDLTSFGSPIEERPLGLEALPDLRFERIAPGSYAVVVAARRDRVWHPIGIERIEIQDREAEVVVPIDFTRFDRSLSVVLTDAYGAPVHGARVWLECSVLRHGVPQMTLERAFFVERAGAPECRLHVFVPAANPSMGAGSDAQHWFLCAEHRDHGTVRMDLGQELPATAALTLESQDRFRVVLPGLRQRLEGGYALLRWSSGSTNSLSRSLRRELDASDGLTLPRTVTASGSLGIEVGDPDAGLTWTLFACELKADVQRGTVRLDLPRTATLTLKFPQELAPSRLHLESESDGRDQPGIRVEMSINSSLHSRSQALRLLPVGRYVIEVHGQRNSIDLTTDLDFHVAGGPSPGLYVEIQDAQGLFARAGLRTDDLIIGIDQVRATDRASADALLQHLVRCQPSKELRVLRSGQVLALPLAAETLREDPDRGGVALVIRAY